MAQPKLMIGTKIVIEQDKPTLIEIGFGREIRLFDPSLVKKIGEQYANLANIAMFLDAYRLMLVTRGEPNATEHVKELMEFLGGMANANTQANSQTRKDMPSNGIQQISYNTPPSDASPGETTC